MRINLINGILGTIIIHLTAGVLFFYAKINGMVAETVQIKIETPETIKEENKEKQQKLTQNARLDKSVDAFIAAQKRSNVGVNVSEKEARSKESDLQQIEKDIDAAKKQISDIQQNLDKQSKPEQLRTSATDQGADMQQPNKDKIMGKLVVYKGPTNIYFDLANRRQLALYVPVYKCQTYGKVVVFIAVNKAGEVETASVDKANSSTDACLTDAAYDAALRTTFNADFEKAPQKQKGSITYLFIAQ